MTSTLAEPGPYDALAKAEPTEPMFPLLARDPCAPAAITEWCRLRRNRAIKLWGESTSDADAKLLAAELAQCASAEQVALDMADWLGEKEAPAAQRVSHGVQRTEEELRAADQRERLAAQVRHLREAAYHISEARDGLWDLGLMPDQTDRDLVAMLARINGLGDEHTPKRPNFTAEPALPLAAPAEQGER